MKRMILGVGCEVGGFGPEMADLLVEMGLKN
jgi:hypothetical protein